MDVPQSLLQTMAIERGSILHSTIFNNIDHGKFFVIIGIYNNKVAGFFFINSNINRYIQAKQNLFAMQYQLKHSEYSFLKYDSFISANEILEISYERLSQSLDNGQTKIIDTLKENHLNELLESARNSKLFSKEEKRKYLY